MKPEFSPNCDWFSHAIPLFNKYLSGYKGKNTQFLEIGSYEGRSACWCIQNILTDSLSKITCIEPYPQDNLYENLLAACQNNKKYTLHICKSYEALIRLSYLHIGEVFDFIYIDGSHESPDVLQDAVLSWSLLKKGGVLAFDDYRHPTYAGVRECVDSFLKCYFGQYEVLEKNYQVWLRKT